MAGALPCASWMASAADLEAAGRLGLSTTAASAPADWDTLCVGGGQRHWGACAPAADGGDGCADGEASGLWGSQMCDCPKERNGLTCAGCANDAACGGEGAFCARALGSLPETALGCTLGAVAPEELRVYLEDFASPSTIGLRVGPRAFALEFTKAVNTPENGDAERLLSGKIFTSTAPDGVVAQVFDIGA